MSPSKRVSIPYLGPKVEALLLETCLFVWEQRFRLWRDQRGSGSQDSSHKRHCIPSWVMGNPVAMGRKNKKIATAQAVKATTTHGPPGRLLHRTHIQYTSARRANA